MSIIVILMVTEIWHVQIINCFKLKITWRTKIFNTKGDSYMPCVAMAHSTKYIWRAAYMGHATVIQSQNLFETCQKWPNCWVCHWQNAQEMMFVVQLKVWKVSWMHPKSIMKHHYRKDAMAERFKLFCSSRKYGHKERPFLLHQKQIVIIHPLLQWRSISNLLPVMESWSYPNKNVEDWLKIVVVHMHCQIRVNDPCISTTRDGIN